MSIHHLSCSSSAFPLLYPLTSVHILVCLFSLFYTSTVLLTSISIFVHILLMPVNTSFLHTFPPLFDDFNHIQFIYFIS